MRQGPQPNQAFSLHKAVLTLGRAVDNDIVIDDSEVSRHHARLTLRGNDWVLEDLGSRNGTFVNGQRITGPVALRPGSQVALGPDVLFSMEGGAPVAPVARRPAARRSASRWLLLAGLAALVVAVLAGAAVLAYFYLNPPTEPSVIAELPTVPGPDIAFQEPAPGTRVNLGTSVLVFATARDENKVARVDLWVDDQLVEQQESPDPNGVTPLSLIHNWVATTPGTHSLMVRAYNSLGAMGESPTLDVTVSGEPEPATAQYVVQPGDTPATVAKVMSTTVAAIQGKNPAMGKVLTPGQIIVVPVVMLLPPSPAQQGPAAGGPQPGGPPPGGPVPVGAAAPGGAVPGGPAPGGPRAGGPAAAKAPGLPAAPDLQDAKIKDCNVTLVWQDKSDNETGFLVYRKVSGAPGYTRLPKAEKARNGTGSQVQYVDQVPRPDAYLYYVAAANTAGQAASHPRAVTVPPTGACIQPAGYKQVIFQPRTVKPTDAGNTALYFSIANSIGRRIPLEQQTNLPPGDWSGHKQAVPAPAPIYLNPGDPVPLTVGGAVWPGAQDLGIFVQSHPQNELVSTKVWKGHGENPNTKKGFDLEYSLWLEKVTWGQGTTAQIPPPTDLKFAQTADELKKKLPICPECDPKRTLIWDWTGDPKKIEGYILYRFYSCPGKDAQIVAPEVVANPAQKGKMIPAWTEPSGCAVRYQVSAYGPAGESKPSDPLDVLASAPIARVRVTFETLTIKKKLAPGTSGVVVLQANQYLLKSLKAFALQSQTHFLDQVFLEGKTKNNVLSVNLGGGDSLQLDFAVASLAGDLICEGEAFSLSSPPNNDWGQYAGKYTLHTTNKDCQVSVKIDKEAVLPAGQVVRPQADLFPSAVGVIGQDVYVFMDNLGPDPLTANQVKLTSYWIDPAGPQPVGEQTIVRSVRIEVGGDQLLQVGTIPQRFAQLKQLPEFRLKITPVDFDDPDMGNNAWEKEPQSVTQPAQPPKQPTAPKPKTAPKPPNKLDTPTVDRATATRFENETSRPIVYLSTDGGPSKISAGFGILTNQYYDVKLTGEHTYLATNGFWEGNTRFDLYQWKGTFKPGDTITFKNPTIEELLTYFGKSAYWEGQFWTGFPVTPHTAGFCFYDNGTFRFYLDGKEDDTGPYKLPSYSDTFIQTFTATSNKENKSFTGTYYETDGYFLMNNGPADWNLIEYHRYPNVACP
jgi:LysM repeat protein